jgi:hypothetical protein
MSAIDNFVYSKDLGDSCWREELITEDLYVINYEILFTSLRLIGLIYRHFPFIQRSSSYLLFSEKRINGG